MKFIWLTVLLSFLWRVDAKSQTVSVERMTIHSSWGGLGTPRRSDLLLERKGKDYFADGRIIPAEQVQALLSAIEEPVVTAPILSNTGITADWLQGHVGTAEKFATYIDYEAGNEAQKQLFRSAFIDTAMTQRRLETLYKSFHTDDYPHMSVTLVLTTGVELDMRSDSQHPLMLPWKVSNEQTAKETYNAHVSKALAALLPHDFTNQGALTSGDEYSDGLVGELASYTGSDIKTRWEALGAQAKAGNALGSLKGFYEVRNPEVNSYHNLAYGKEWKGGDPQEENLHVNLWRAGFPKGFVVNAVLLRKSGKVEGVELLPEKAKSYEQLALSVDWLKHYLDTHPNQYACLFYVHGLSFTPKSMRIFAADMKAAGRNDLVSRVREVQDKVALIETAPLESSLEYGQGNYWLVLPDKTVILWRWQTTAGVLLWKPTDFPAKECSEYGTVTGGCSGAVISPTGQLLR